MTKILTQKNSITIEGVKREKIKGDKIDIPIHSTNVIITTLNTDDKWRMNKLQGNSKDSIKEIKQKEVEEKKQNEKLMVTENKTKKSKKEKDVKK